MNGSECNSCKAPIIWVRTATGKVMPVDARPAEDGNMVIDDGVARVIAKGESPPVGKLRWKSHFATCPAAQSFRKKR